MARVVTIAMQKGGVGKTTTAINLGAALAQRDQRVLVIDLDPQASLTEALGLVRPGEDDAPPLSLYDALYGTPVVSLEQTIRQVAGMDVVPSHINLAAAELQLVVELGRERVLATRLEPLRALYDFILIDSPPSLGMLTINGLAAADDLLIPVQCQFLAFQGLELILDSFTKVRQRINPRIELLGILPTMFDGRTAHHSEVVRELRARFPGKVFSPISHTVRFADSALAGKPLIAYDPRHGASEAYRQLAQEVIRG